MQHDRDHHRLTVSYIQLLLHPPLVYISIYWMFAGVSVTVVIFFISSCITVHTPYSVFIILPHLPSITEDGDSASSITSGMRIYQPVHKVAGKAEGGKSPKVPHCTLHH